MYYVAHRLFALHDRALGALVAERLGRQVGDENVFLPFCDTDEENLHTEATGRRLFELDSDRLREMAGMVAVLHGPSLDDGVCMEMGFAFQLGVPVVVLTTDFQRYGLHEDGPRLAFPDPLIEVLASGVIRVDQMGGVARGGRGRFEVFQSRNRAPLEDAADAAVMALLRSASLPGTGACGQNDRAHVAYLEPSPYHRVEAWWSRMARELRTAGWKTHVAGRHRPGRRRTGAGLTAAVALDWSALRSAELLLVDVSGPESPPGAAVAVGVGAAKGSRVFIRHASRSCTFASGREPNHRNLMIEYAAAGRFGRTAELRRLLDL